MRRLVPLIALLLVGISASTSLAGTAAAPTPSLPATAGDDLLLHRHGTSSDRIMRSRGDGTFSVTTTTDIVMSYPTWVSGDFNGDGYSDVILGQSRYLKNARNGKFYALPFDNGGYGWDNAHAGDFDGDGDSDLLLYGVGTDPDSLLRSNGNDTFTHLPLAIHGVYWPVVADLEGDGDDDVVLVSRPGNPTQDRLLRSRGDGTFAVASLPPIPSTAKPLPGDYDGDGRGDLLLYRHSLLLSRPGPSFETISNDIGQGFEPVPFDFDRDGDTDLFLNRNYSSRDLLLVGRGDGTFAYRALPVLGTVKPIAGNFDGR